MTRLGNRLDIKMQRQPQSTKQNVKREWPMERTLGGDGRYTVKY